jgi:hypothetical protein
MPFCRNKVRSEAGQVCQKILIYLKLTIEKEYSRILMNEVVILEERADWFSTSLDILVMMVHSSLERKEREWRALMEGVEGLKIVKIWKCDGVPEQLIEVELV